MLNVSYRTWLYDSIYLDKDSKDCLWILADEWKIVLMILNISFQEYSTCKMMLLQLKFQRTCPNVLENISIESSCCKYAHYSCCWCNVPLSIVCLCVMTAAVHVMCPYPLYVCVFTMFVCEHVFVCVWLLYVCVLYVFICECVYDILLTCHDTQIGLVVLWMIL